MTNSIMLRLPDAEFSAFGALAKAAGLPPAVLARKIITDVCAQRTRKAVSGDDFRRLLVELTRQGNNINQLTRLLNSGLASDIAIAEILRLRKIHSDILNIAIEAARSN